MNPSYRRITRPLVVLSLLLFIASSAALAAAPQLAAGALPTLRVNAGSFPVTLDPQLAGEANQVGHLRLIYEGLARVDTSLNTVPGAAESWTYSPDALALNFLLREGLTYSDGTPLNALRFEYALLRALDPAVLSPYAPLLDEITGANAYRTADPTLSPAQLDALRAAVQVKAHTLVDDLPCSGYDQADCRVLKLAFDVPAAYFHTLMSMVFTYPAKEELITSSTWWQDPAKQVGNGPFVLASLTPYTSSRYTPNTHYWRGTPNYEILYSYLASSAALTAYQTGDLDILPITTEIVETIALDPTLSAQAHTYTGTGTFAVLYHHDKEPFDNQDVRAAFSFAVDRAAWVADLLGNDGATTLTWIAPGYPGYDAGETRWNYDPAAAVQALADSGFTVNAEGDLVASGGKVVKIVDTYANTLREIARHEWLAAKWYEVLGVRVHANPVAPNVYHDLLKDPDTAPLIQIWGWNADYPDPHDWLCVYWRTGSLYTARIAYSNPALDALLDQADETIDPALRLQKYEEAQDLLIAGAPGTFLYNPRIAFLVNPLVQGAVGTPMDTLWMGELDPLLVVVPQPAASLAFYLPVVLK